MRIVRHTMEQIWNCLLLIKQRWTMRWNWRIDATPWPLYPVPLATNSVVQSMYPQRDIVVPLWSILETMVWAGIVMPIMMLPVESFWRIVFRSQPTDASTRGPCWYCWSVSTRNTTVVCSEWAYSMLNGTNGKDHYLHFHDGFGSRYNR